jgi:NAD(P)-dependent dehydrogenase (short-subunit alcohol dehydrogenase family)
MDFTCGTALTGRIAGRGVMRRNLRGTAILLTGGSRGIGRHVAGLMAGHGARMVLAARDEKDLNKAVEELRASGTEVYAAVGDLTLPADREGIVATAVEKLGGLDVLINNAGTCSFGEFASSKEDVLRKVMEVNFFAPAEMTRLCLPHLARSRKRPAVVNVASICGRRGIPSFPEHCASKFALVGLTECLRAEFVRFGVEALLVVPGLARVDDFEKHLLRNEGRIFINWERAQGPEKVARGIVRALRRNWKETVVGWLALQIHRLARVWPSLVDGIMIRKVMNFEKRHGRA